MKNIFLLFSVFFILGCSECDESFTATKIQATTISKGPYFNPNYFVPQHGLIIYNQQQWNDFKSLAWQLPEDSDNLEVNFDQYIVIAAIDKEHTSGVHDIEIISVTEYSSNVIVKISYSQNTEDGTGISRPYHFVKIPKPLKDVILKNAIF